MPQPLDPAIQAIWESRPPDPPLPSPRPPLPELARMLRGEPAPPAEPAPFDGEIAQIMAPVRWGQIAARIYRPRSAGERPPAVAFFHGGGFIACDLDTHDQLCRELALASRTLLVSFAYRLAPEAPFPGGLEDCYDATCWLAASAEQLGADPSRLGVAGDSAGGNLATGVAMLARDAGAPRLGYQLLIYPKVDFVTSYPSQRECAALGIPDELAAVFDDCYLPDRAMRGHPLASPALAPDLRGMPPGLILSADCDTLRDEAEAYGDALRRAGAAVATLRAIGMPHGFAGMPGVPPAAQITLAAGALMGAELRR